jgi:aqualysin 1
MKSFNQFRAAITSGVSAVVLVSVFGASAVMAQAPAQSARPDHAFGPSKPIPDSYIVVFKDSVANPAAEAQSLMRGRGGQINFIYSNSIKGFAATLPAAAVEALRKNPNVDYIEQDMTVSLNSTTTQTGATWGLDRIDQAALPLSKTYNYSADGTGVTAYIIDTGIRASHSDFGGRVSSGFSAIAGGTDDCNGHGTHVAGTVGGTTWGVAKKVTLVPVRVLDCNGSGTNSGVIAGVDWVAGAGFKPTSVANMSLGGGASSTLDTAVRNAGAKVTMVVAAGNSNANACNYSPAREPSAITVGATTSTDARSSFSNFGKCLDLFAPGSSITSAVSTSDTATATWNGTSMAAPHVAGVAALVLQGAPSSTPAQVTAAILDGVTLGKVTSAGTGSPNRLLYSMVAAGGDSGTGDGTGGTDEPLAAPTNFQASNVQKTSATLSWSSVTNADNYLLEISTRSDFATIV